LPSAYEHLDIVAVLHKPCLYSQLDTLREQKHAHVREVRLQMTLLGLGWITFGKAQGRRIRKGRACRGFPQTSATRGGSFGQIV